MTPGPMSEVMAEASHRHTLDVSSSDVQLRLFFLQMLGHESGQVCYA